MFICKAVASNVLLFELKKVKEFKCDTTTHACVQGINI